MQKIWLLGIVTIAGTILGTACVFTGVGVLIEEIREPAEISEIKIPDPHAKVPSPKEFRGKFKMIQHEPL